MDFAYAVKTARTLLGLRERQYESAALRHIGHEDRVVAVCSGFGYDLLKDLVFIHHLSRGIAVEVGDYRFNRFDALLSGAEGDLSFDYGVIRLHV